jgi:DNA-binding CsgD family transcriptional regulator
LLVQALEEAGDDDLLRGRVLDQLGWLRGQLLGDVRAGVVDMREALEIAEREHDPELEMSAASGLASLECLAGVWRGDLHERAVALEAEIGRPLLWGGPRHLLATDLRLTGELAGARELLEAVYAECLTLGNERWRPHALHGLVIVEWQAGDLVRAEELLDQALEAARDDEDATAVQRMQGAVALLAVLRGRGDEARTTIEQMLESAERSGRRSQRAQARTLLGALSLALGDPAAAARDLADAVEILQGMGYANPVIAWAYPLRIEALAGSGELDAAQDLLDVVERQVDTLDNDLARAVLDRCRGAVALARGDPRAALAPLECSVASFDRLGYRLEAALSVLVLGRAFLRAGQRSSAADALADARDRFASMGACLWQERAAEELERAAPGRGTGELTPAERRVAALVTEGAKNREIGQALFMSIATVEAHLTRIYRKLGIRSRSELARLVAAGDISVADEDDSSGEPAEGPQTRS